MNPENVYLTKLWRNRRWYFSGFATTDKRKRTVDNIVWTDMPDEAQRLPTLLARVYVVHLKLRYNGNGASLFACLDETPSSEKP